MYVLPRSEKFTVQFPCNHVMVKDSVFKGSEKHNCLTYREQTKSDCWPDIFIASSIHLEFQPCHRLCVI